MAANLSGLALEHTSEQLEIAAIDEKVEEFQELTEEVILSIEALKTEMTQNFTLEENS